MNTVHNNFKLLPRDRCRDYWFNVYVSRDGYITGVPQLSRRVARTVSLGYSGDHKCVYRIHVIPKVAK